MKYVQKRIDGTDCHVFTADPSKGHFTALRSYGLQKVSAFHHGWFEQELKEVPFAAINGSYFDFSTGSVVGGMYVDSGFILSPFLSDDKFVTMVWEGGVMSLDESHYVAELKSKYPNMEMAIQLGDPLVKDGVAYSGDGHFDHTWGDNPRTFIGQLKSNEIVMFSTDGRTGSDKGFTAADLRQIALDMGCQTAVMCDGGGSSTMLIEGQMVNDNENRKIPAVFMFYSTPGEEVEWVNEVNTDLLSYKEFLDSEISDGIKWRDLLNGLDQIYLNPDIWDWCGFSISYDRLLSSYFFPNFTFKEFACQDDGQIMINEEVYTHGMHMQQMRYDLDFAMKIGSWTRTRRHNTAVNGSSLSTHIKCIATDVNTLDKSKVNKINAYWKNKNYGGIGLYSWGIHTDDRGYLKEWWG